ncbi:cation:proton antiporter [Sphingomonas sp. SUN019]|uniref:cation:proton antiporter n=1 Tax=Sphingomonas sp. SUN019 TaxID=2937788 RepID=UPI002164724D|nr:cation:proton antiporter [Sphingomonas sp. SUN019]UVO50742.1 cation:proton antiporter [Sphingomonas sp. SUN019]
MDFASLYLPALLGAGLLVLLVAWLPLVLKKLPLSLPIICVGIGAGLGTLVPLAAYVPHPLETPVLVEKMTELIVIVSLMGAGLKIDHRFDFGGWKLTPRLLAIAMPLGIGAFLLAGQAILGLGLATALLLAAVLAPTDPVLAADVQIEEPDSHRDDEVRFALTSEAGLNDALAFPFVHLAIAAATTGLTAAAWRDWAMDAVAVRLLVGGAVGVASGWAMGKIIYRLPGDTRLSRTGDGFVALGATLSIYAATELLHGYGFLAVFVAGLMLRRAARGHDFNDKLHGFADEVERLLMMVLLVVFGAMLTASELFRLMGWPELLFALVAIFVIRPVTAWIALIGSGRPASERAIIAFFGIRGLGSVFYLAYALNHGTFDGPERLWGALGLVILISILLHGVTVTPVMRWVDRRREQA